MRRLALKLEADLPDIEALVLDGTGFPKKGKHSVGVARQYSGTLGRTTARWRSAFIWRPSSSPRRTQGRCPLRRSRPRLLHHDPASPLP